MLIQMIYYYIKLNMNMVQLIPKSTKNTEDGQDKSQNPSTVVVNLWPIVGCMKLINIHKFMRKNISEKNYYIHVKKSHWISSIMSRCKLFVVNTRPVKCDLKQGYMNYQAFCFTICPIMRIYEIQNNSR